MNGLDEQADNAKAGDNAKARDLYWKPLNYLACPFKIVMLKSERERERELLGAIHNGGV